MKPKVEFFKASDFDLSAFPPQMNWAGCVAARANALLSERGTVVYGWEYRDGWFNRVKYAVVPPCKDEKTSNLQALLIDVKPIQKDTAEGLLRHMVKEWEEDCNYENLSCVVQEWIDKARKLMNNKNG